MSPISFSFVRTNLLAGLTVGVVALPLAMALAIAVGVPPQYGLYTSIVAGVVIGLTGGCKVNISGPTAAFVVILIPIVKRYGLGGLLICGMMSGVILVLMGLGRLGNLIRLVPYPVTIGLTAGIGTVIASLQIKDFFGLRLESTGHHFAENLALFYHASPSWQWNELLIGTVTLAVLIAWSKSKSKIPAHLVGLVVGTLLAFGLGVWYPEFKVATIGSSFHYVVGGLQGSGIPPLIPSFVWPWELPGPDGRPIGLSLDLIREFLPHSLTIALLGALESLLCAVIADGMTGQQSNPNRELIGQGLGNILVPFFSGIPATAAIARTATNIRLGGSARMASVIHGLFILASILVLSPLLSYLPMASMAAILVIVAWNMSEVRHFVNIVKVAPRSDVLVLLACYLLTVFLDMQVAVGVGIVMAALLFIRRTIEQTEISIVGNSEIKQSHELMESVLVYDINGPMFFGAAQRAFRSLVTVHSKIKVVILDMSDVTMIDMTAMVSLQTILNSLEKAGVKTIACNLKPKVEQNLVRAGIDNQPGRIMLAKDMAEAIYMARRRLKSL